ncbi:MAG: acyl-CoA dehydrogenase family protein [Actinomycetota bacterium]|nr:acyl-CoA dehydrogenase family protein [Actinomycetota bacterium]
MSGTETTTEPAVADAPDLDTFRSDVAAFLAEAKADGTACPAFGAIMPPRFHDQARAWQRRMYDAGYAGIHWPVEYGGRGLGRDHAAIWAEECAKAQVQTYLNLQGIVLAGEAILRSGTDEQKARFLRPTLSGEILWCQLFSEPNAGSDLASLAATAVADGDRFIVNGQKVWCSNGQFAEFGILLARTGGPGHRGISFFLIDMSLPGIEVRPLKQMTGDEEFTEVFLTDVSLPADALLGPLDAGWQVAMAVLQDERGSSGSAGLISLERRLAHLASLKGEDEVLGDELMQLLVDGHALKTMLMRSGGGAANSSAAKLLRTELEFGAEGLEASLRGAEAMLDGPRTERFLYSPGMKIAGGSSEIQRNIIGERILGLPREPRPN